MARVEGAVPVVDLVLDADVDGVDHRGDVDDVDAVVGHGLVGDDVHGGDGDGAAAEVAVVYLARRVGIAAAVRRSPDDGLAVGLEVRQEVVVHAVPQLAVVGLEAVLVEVHVFRAAVCVVEVGVDVVVVQELPPGGIHDEDVVVGDDRIFAEGRQGLVPRILDEPEARVDGIYAVGPRRRDPLPVRRPARPPGVVRRAPDLPAVVVADRLRLRRHPDVRAPRDVGPLRVRRVLVVLRRHDAELEEVVHREGEVPADRVAEDGHLLPAQDAEGLRPRQRTHGRLAVREAVQQRGRRLE
mmetsp:Transcript_25654/g.83138  ORF Transcript_25654/g.83138 Transcript_25654/m.83138 type:complete len:297 (+) Transcript_25654:1798-2688(+)